MRPKSIHEPTTDESMDGLTVINDQPSLRLPHETKSDALP
jgi:hypothetical protein